MKNPCKDEKCILYPACVKKKEISCSILVEHIIEFRTSHPTSDNGHEILWRYLEKFLPKLGYIFGL